MSVNLTFYTLEERQPKDRQEIWVIQTARPFGFVSYDFKYGYVEKQWEEQNPKDGFATGTSYAFDPDGEPPPNCELVYVFNRTCLAPTDLWASCESLESQFLKE